MTEGLHDVNARLERLERENRRLKRWAGVACGGFALLGLAGAAAPAICDVVSAERLVLRDNGGRQRLVVDAYQTDSPTLVLQTREGKTLARLGIDERGEAYFNLYDKQGGAKAAWSSGGCATGGAGKGDASKPAEDKGAGATTTVFKGF